MGKRKLQSYTAEFKESSAKLAVSAEVSIAATARNLGISHSTLDSWVRKYYPESKESHPTKSICLPESQELKKLKKENARLRQERDILKKAAAYFASEMQ